MFLIYIFEHFKVMYLELK